MSDAISLGHIDPKVVEKDNAVLPRFAAQRAGMLGLNLSFYTVHFDSATGNVTADLKDTPDIEVEVS